ncbi:hypothetical protein ACLVWU_13200 [Bdellovibrio sp. HCB290]|uniref:hypothetical protein n=1 Tax=Bdellovibrio sp. HCB290 TaxID=3394356 RepID=UPI0039B49FA2
MSQSFLEIHSLQNLTTEFELIKNIKGKPLQVLEYSEKTFAFEAGPRMCGLGTILNFEGKYHIRGHVVEFLGTGRVTRSEPLDEGKSAKYTVELHRFDKGLWELFISANRQSQQSTDLLFRSMRELE